MSAKEGYLRGQILAHAGRFFNPDAVQALQASSISFMPFSQAADLREPVIAVPSDVEASSQPESIWQVPFNGTKLTLWNRVPKPDSTGWSAWPDDNSPVWFRHVSGTHIPVWNLYGNLLDLLTFREESDDKQRDRHGRFMGAYSPRQSPGLLEVPAFNEAVALLIAAAMALQSGSEPADTLAGLVKPPVVVLSHDCDCLEGNDLWTQAIRGYRALRPVLSGRKPELKHLRWAKGNASSPREYYFDNVLKMVELEQKYGARSILYFLNGTGGRYGARSAPGLISELTRKIPEGWEMGLHYNYDTHLDSDKLARQKAALEELAGRQMLSGRAHYLRFDPAYSFPLYESHGIRCDESSGFVDFTGYRNGMAGCFAPWDNVNARPHDVYELPMTIMESTLLAQYGQDAGTTLRKMLRHLKAVGGALTLLFHPDKYDNPEHPDLIGAYENWLGECQNAGAEFLTPSELILR